MNYIRHLKFCQFHLLIFLSISVSTTMCVNRGYFPAICRLCCRICCLFLLYFPPYRCFSLLLYLSVSSRSLLLSSLFFYSFFLFLSLPSLLLLIILAATRVITLRIKLHFNVECNLVFCEISATSYFPFSGFAN